MTYASPVCKGDILLGSACRRCEKCHDQIKLFREAQEQFNKTGKTPLELDSCSASRISSLEDKLEALTLRVDYLADAIYGKQAVAQNCSASSLFQWIKTYKP